MKNANKEQVDAVQRMLDLIEKHIEKSLDLRQLADAAGYSSFHAARMFKDLVGIPPSEYLRARRLSHAALRLRDRQSQVNEAAADVCFETHAGFTRAFARQFGETPEQYRSGGGPIPLFFGTNVRLLFDHGQNKETIMTETNTVFVKHEHRDARKLILQRARSAGDYWVYCEECGCDVWGLLLSLHGGIGEPMGIWLPEHMRKPGTSEYVMGLEVSSDYDGPIPDGMEIVPIPAQDYLVFQGQPYNDDDMAEEIGKVWRAIDAYKPESIGWTWNIGGLRYQLAPMGERGYIEGRPVKSVK